MTTIDSKAEAMSRLADFLIGAEHHYDGQALTILVEGREAIRAYLAALPSPKVEEEPVAWRVKDFGDGWIPARSHGEALQLAASTGALIQPLYVSPSPVLADEGVAGWQLIETAPKDSHSRLVWCPERQNTYIVSWDTFAYSPSGNQAGLMPPGWAHVGAHRRLDEVPSHWAPLPIPPAVTP